MFSSSINHLNAQLFVLIMICVIALVVASVLGIFSASYREIAKEAFDCVTKKVTFRPCTTGLDSRLKTRISSSIFRYVPRLSKWVYKHFELCSWIFLVLSVVSLVYVGIGTYNYVLYGNCNGPSSAFCVFNALSGESFSVSASNCASGSSDLAQSLIVPNITQVKGLFVSYIPGAPMLVEFGCYSCNYTKKAQLILDKIMDSQQVSVLFVPFPLPQHNLSELSAKASICANQFGIFSQYHRWLLNQSVVSQESLIEHATFLNVSSSEFESCLADTATQKILDDFVYQGHYAGIYGTPTFFIEDKAFVGPQTYAFFKKQLTGSVW
jgi:hypothetical protein